MPKSHQTTRPTRTLLAVASLFAASQASAIPARFAVSPDSSLDNLISAIESADRTLIINMYQFDHPTIVDAVMRKVRAGVAVQVLLEGEPVGGLSAGHKALMINMPKEMKKSGQARDRFFVMSKKVSGARRFRYDHAKYVIVDGSRVVLSSENFTSTGHPAAGTKGNRGWEVTLDDAGLARQLAAMFKADTDLKAGDLFELVATADPATPDAVTPKIPLGGAKRGARPIEAARGEVSSYRLISSPESLDALVAMIRSARHHLEIQQMSLPRKWGAGAKAVPSPLVAELVAAAKRGVTVRVIVNDDNVFGKSKTMPNLTTSRFLNSVALCQRVPIDARVIDIKKDEITYIHNKGMLVDGVRALVSSINGTQNSVMANRETAIRLESPMAAKFYGQAFSFDWDNSPALPDDPTTCGQLFPMLAAGLLPSF